MGTDTIKNIAIMSATSHIAKGLIYNFTNSKNFKTYLFARTPEKVKEFININILNTNQYIGEYNQLNNFKYDCIINCVGIGRHSSHEDIFELTEKYDNLIISYLQNNRSCMYINFSSGAVYGNFDSFSNFNSTLTLEVNDIRPDKYLTIAKLNSETKHRALKDFNIVDLRVFAYISRFIDLDSGFLIAEIIKSIKENVVLKTNSADIIRDYTNPSDLYNLILKCVEKNSLNDVFDVYSKKPVTKFEILEFFTKKYGLNYAIDDKLFINNATGDKNIYYSKYKKAKDIGYEPLSSSIESIEKETAFILTK